MIVVSHDLDWLMDLSEALRSINPTSHTSLSTALAQATDQPVLMVTAPPETQMLMEDPTLLRSSRALVIAVTPKVSVEVLRQAAAVGIRDVVAANRLVALHPALASLDAMAERHREIDESQEHEDPGKVILVTSAKAGQGTTTVAVNLAITLAEQTTTALVEGDPRFGDVFGAMGYRQLRTELVPADLLPGKWIDRWLFRHPSGVIVVLPPPDSVDNLRPEEAVEAIDLLQGVCDRIVIDMPFWVMERYRLHRIADATLVVSRDGQRELAHVPMLVRSLGLPAEETRLVISNHRKRRTPRASRLAEITGLEPIALIPEMSDKAVAAIDKGEPLADVRQREKALGEAFSLLARDLDQLDA